MTTFTNAFVTGSTGLLGNNLVRALIKQGVKVTALARSRAKATRQFAGLEINIVEGDMTNVSSFQGALQDIDVLFHTAAYFRDSFKGGQHREALYKINVEGTENLLAAAYEAGIRRMVHTSSVAVLTAPAGTLINETMERPEAGADDYFLSKILSDRKVHAFLAGHRDMNVSMVLPGWMIGPGDIGPTSSGQMVLDFVRKKLPGIVPATFSVVDARDVAWCQIAAAERGRSGERYLAAGRNMTLAEVSLLLEKVTGVPAPTRRLPMAALFGLGACFELYARITGKPVLLSLASVRLMASEAGRTQFDHRKSERELGLTFRPIEETFSDVVAWYRSHGYLG
jgi:dihydroflavonol-4-reductase